MAFTYTPLGGGMVMQPGALASQGMDDMIAMQKTADAAGVGGQQAAGGGGMNGAMGGLAVGSAIGQMVSNVITAYTSSKLAGDSLKTQKHISENNAKIAQMGYESAMRAGESEIQKITMQAGSLKSKQRAAMAANGIKLGVGSAADVTASTDVMKKLDVNTAKSNALAAAFGYSTRASNFRSQAAVQGIAGNYNINAAPAMAAGTLMENVGAVADRWYKYFGDN